MDITSLFNSIRTGNIGTTEGLLRQLDAVDVYLQKLKNSKRSELRQQGRVFESILKRQLLSKINDGRVCQ
jgi:hypothetical protein